MNLQFNVLKILKLISFLINAYLSLVGQRYKKEVKGEID